MCMTKHAILGFTLIEVIIFIVVVSAGLAGILLVSTTVVKSSADPMVRKQALSVAESLLEEITLKEYKDPNGGTNGVTTCTGGAFITTDSPSNNRGSADDVCDYNGYVSNGGVRDITGTPVTGLSGYNVAVTVGAPATVTGGGATVLRSITVTVSWGGDSVTLVGYRGNY